MEISFLTLAVAPSVVALIAVPASPSRRRLVVALSVAIPVAGPILAVMVSRVRGTGKVVERGDVREGRGPRIEIQQIRRLGELPSMLEMLVSERSSDRQTALVVLSSRADAEAVKMLRWAVNHGNPDAVLDAALTLSELDVRFEQELAAGEEAYLEAPSRDTALRLANTIADAIHCQLPDPAIAIGLSERARALYLEAARLDIDRAGEAVRELARLEIATGEPRAAAERLESLVGEAETPSPDLMRLYEQARFRARRPILPGRSRSRLRGRPRLRPLPPS